METFNINWSVLFFFLNAYLSLLEKNVCLFSNEKSHRKCLEISYFRAIILGRNQLELHLLCEIAAIRTDALL